MRGRWAIEDQTAPWHFLYFLPLPHGQGSLRSTLATGGLGFGGWAAVAAGCVRRMASKAAEAGGRRVAMRAARSCCWALISSGLSLAAWRVNGELGSEVKPPCAAIPDRKSTRLNSSHSQISYAVFCLKKKKKTTSNTTNSNTRT